MSGIATDFWLKSVHQCRDHHEKDKVMSQLKKTNQKTKTIKPGGVVEYIAKCPQEFQKSLREIRAVIRAVAPNAIETVSYFNIPGYAYKGFEYNGMFVWFSFKAPYVRLHVRPVAITSHKKILEKYVKTKAIVSFPANKKIPKALIKKLVRSSLKDMRSSAK